MPPPPAARGDACKPKNKNLKKVLHLGKQNDFLDRGGGDDVKTKYSPLSNYLFIWLVGWPIVWLIVYWLALFGECLVGWIVDWLVKCLARLTDSLVK